MRRPLIEDDSLQSGIIGPSLSVKFKRKLENQVWFTLYVTTNEETVRVTKKLADFDKLQAIVNEVTEKRNAQFRNQGGLDEDRPIYNI